MTGEFQELLEAFCRDELTAEQRQQLADQVRTDPELRRAYVRYIHMHICLRRAFKQAETTPVNREGEAPAEPRPTISAGSGHDPRQSDYHGSAGASPSRSVHSIRFLRTLAAASVMLAGCGLIWWLLGNQAQSAPVAVLTNAVGCAWEGPQAPAVGSRLSAGRLELSAGMAEITCGGGAVVLIEAPAVLELLDGAHGFLHAGRVVIRVPPAATGFVMETRKARLVDHGTEFGVDVGNSGDTLVQVFDGVVVADSKEDATAPQQRVTAGQTVQIGGEPRQLTSTPERFIRHFPHPDERGSDWLVPYNQRKYDRVHIVPAPGPVKIDGDLSDWDRSGQFFIACDEPFAKDYYIEGCMMYDRRHLYIGAHVADPAPMCSVINPLTDPGAGWKGGSVQVRLATDRQAGWPLTGQWAGVPGYRPNPQDKDPHLVHLTLWYFKPKELPCLHIAHGMHLRGDRINPPGFQAAFKKDADGRGYTIEYAIPWELLQAGDDPPQAGDVLGACWNVHWSDEEGRLWKGYLVDIINPAEKGFTYWRAATWGRAIYHEKGRLPPGTLAPR